MNKHFIVLILTVLIWSVSTFPADEHHRADEDEHGHGTAVNRAVGADKGILRAEIEKGFQLSPEATKNFGITLKDLGGPGRLTVPRSSIFFGLHEQNLYRVRDGFYKRIDFTVVTKTSTQFTLNVKDVKAGDKIALTGLGFLRIAELQAFGGISDGHSH